MPTPVDDFQLGKERLLKLFQATESPNTLPTFLQVVDDYAHILALTRQQVIASATDAHGTNLLHAAVTNANLPVVKYLINGHPSLDQANKAGDLPLHVAVRTDCQDVVDAVLRQTRPDSIFILNLKSETPLSLAVSMSAHGILESMTRVTPFKAVEGSSANATVLQWAVVRSDLKSLEILVNWMEKEAVVSEQCREGSEIPPAVVLAASMTDLLVGEKMVELMQRKGGPEILFLTDEGEKLTALHNAAEAGNEKIVRGILSLAEAKELCSLRAADGRTPYLMSKNETIAHLLEDYTSSNSRKLALIEERDPTEGERGHISYPDECEDLKRQANEAVCEERWRDALALYENAISLTNADDCDNLSDRRLSALFSNKSFVLTKLRRFPDAFAAAQKAVQWDKTWSKAWYRMAVAAKGQNNYVEALDYLWQARHKAVSDQERHSLHILFTQWVQERSTN